MACAPAEVHCITRHGLFPSEFYPSAHKRSCESGGAAGAVRKPQPLAVARMLKKSMPLCRAPQHTNTYAIRWH